MSRYEPLHRLRDMLDYSREAVSLKIDFDIVWQILTRDLPPLITDLERIIAQEENTQADC